MRPLDDQEWDSQFNFAWNGSELAEPQDGHAISVLSPLNAPVEVCSGSVNHMLCLGFFTSGEKVNPSVEIYAEFLANRCDMEELEKVLMSSPDARAHIMRISANRTHLYVRMTKRGGALEDAQRIVASVEAKMACQEALGELL